MRTRPNVLHNLVDSVYHESFDRYAPRQSSFYELVSSRLPAGWELKRQHLWFYCFNPQNLLPQQGWKIHISARLSDAYKVLDRVSEVLFRRHDINFKFALDAPVLQLINSKNFSRGSSAKFITIYPPNDHCFLDVIEHLHQKLNGLMGPYILSDHRYKTSSTVFYRYGGMQLYDVLNVKGERVPMLIAPDGKQVPDQRAPYPVTAEWASAPLIQHEATDDDKEASQTLKQGRYEIESVIDFSNAGGVYKAFDHVSQRPVLIKEARPFINESPDGRDAIAQLKKEYRLLAAVADTGIAPVPVDLFQEWEHWFLVEEYIDGMVLSSHSAAHNVLLRTRPGQIDFEEWHRIFREICLNLIRIVEVLHDRGIVFADLSPSNVMVLTGQTCLKIIDFEGAHQKGVDCPTGLYTAGFASPDRLSGTAGAIEDDYYSLGAVLFSYLFPWNGLFHFSADSPARLMQSICRDSRLPKNVTNMVLGLINHDRKQRSTPAHLRQLLEQKLEAQAEPPCADIAINYSTVLKRMVDHWQSTADFERDDRLFPADPKLFSTNPLSLAFGACGVAYAWHRIHGEVPTQVLQWIQRKTLTPQSYPPGLYVGLAGIAWSLLEIGLLAEAERAMRLIDGHPLAYETCDLFYGTAGWGMASLRLWMATQNSFYLSLAEKAGAHLIKQCREDERGCHWGESSDTPLGLAHGSSGIALFLLYLYLATRHEKYLAVGERALDFDLSFGIGTKDGGLTWAKSAASSSPVYPYWQHGSAGVGIATARYCRLLGETRLQGILEKIYLDADRRYSVFAGRFTGLAGIGDFLLDMHDLTSQDRYLHSARRLAEGMMNLQVEHSGIAFPGSSLSRLSSDFGTGGAGIALFLNRLTGRQQNDFMLDALFAGDVTVSTEREEAIQEILIRP